MNAQNSNNQTVDLSGGRPFILKNGGRLHELVIHYETWGQLSSTGDNAILLCHALTGDAHATGWWDGLVGEGLAIDTNKYFVVCSNVLGGCYGSTGPLSLKPEFLDDSGESDCETDGFDGVAAKENISTLGEGDNSKGRQVKNHKPSPEPYGSDFPTITIRDMVRAQELLTNHLGIKSWFSIIGGSMGGMQALEWASTFPEKVQSIVPLCSTLAATPWQIAFSSVGRNIIKYVDDPQDALAMARALAMISYRSDQLFESRFGRELVNPDKFYELWNKFQVESYLEYQGTVLADKFDPNSYLILNKAMDLHDIGRNRGGVVKAAADIKAPTLILSVDSDLLYPVRLQEQMASLIPNSRHEIIESSFGHDGFLLEVEKVGSIIGSFLGDVANHDFVNVPTKTIISSTPAAN